MKISVIEMPKCGVPIPRRMLNDRYTVAMRASLVIMDVTDQGLRRQVKVARLMLGDEVRSELVEPHIVWAGDGRFTLSGFRRRKNDDGALVDYAQSWLCALEHTRTPDVGAGKR